MAAALGALWGLVACAPEEPVASLEGSASEGLVFVRHDDKGAADLWRARLADGAVARLRDTPDVNELWPYWSPEAGMLVFQSGPAEDEHRSRLVLLEPRSGELRPLTEPPALREHWPVWSPDGTRVAYTFAGRPSGGPPTGVAWTEVADRRTTLIAAGSEDRSYYRSEFAPDGRRLVAQRSSNESGSKLWILEAGSAPRRLTADEESFEQKGRFTRDGAWIVYTRRPAPRAPGDLVLIRPDGSGAHLIASRRRADDHTARASPTRDELAFISNRSGNPEAYRVNLAGGRPVRLTRTPRRAENAPRWSPDGERIALTVEVPERGFHVVVVDRVGHVLLDVPGAMPDWMPPWSGPAGTETGANQAKQERSVPSQSE